MFNTYDRQQLTLKELAEKRFLYTISFRVAKIRLDQELVINHDSPEVHELMTKCDHLLKEIRAIDDCFMAYFRETGRLN